MENKTTVLVWFKVYDYMYMYADEAQREVFDKLANSADLLFTPDQESYQSALEREYEEKVMLLDKDTDNTEDAKSDIAAKLGRPISELNILGPEEMRDALVGDSKDDSFDYSEINMMGKQIGPMTEEDFIKKTENLPGRIGEKLKELVGSIDEVNQEANEIFGRYISESEDQGIDSEQAKKEAKSYMTGEIPAAEFIAPVLILDELRNL